MILLAVGRVSAELHLDFGIGFFQVDLEVSTLQGCPHTQPIVIGIKWKVR